MKVAVGLVWPLAAAVAQRGGLRAGHQPAMCTLPALQCRRPALSTVAEPLTIPAGLLNDDWLGWALAGASLIAEQVPGRSRWLRWKVTRPRRRVTAPGSDHRSVRPVIGRTARCAAVVVVAASPSVATHEAGPSCNVPSFFTETIVVYRGGMPGGTCSGDRASHSRCGRGTSGSAVREPDGGDANQFSAVRWKLLDRQTVAHVGREALGQPVNRGRRQKVYADRELPVLRLGDRVANSNLGGPGPSRVRDDGWTEVLMEK